MPADHALPASVQSWPTPEHLADLPSLTAGELAERLCAYVEGCGGLISAEDVEVASECVRRARRAEAAEIAAVEQDGRCDAARDDRPVRLVIGTASPPASGAGTASPTGYPRRGPSLSSKAPGRPSPSTRCRPARSPRRRRWRLSSRCRSSRTWRVRNSRWRRTPARPPLLPGRTACRRRRR